MQIKSAQLDSSKAKGLEGRARAHRIGQFERRILHSIFKLIDIFYWSIFDWLFFWMHSCGLGVFYVVFLFYGLRDVFIGRMINSLVDFDMREGRTFSIYFYILSGMIIIIYFILKFISLLRN